jgi:chromosome partitioning protein
MAVQDLTAPVVEDAASKIVRHAEILSSQLQAVRQRQYKPEGRKELRSFSTKEVSELTSIPESTLKLLSSQGKGPTPTRLENNHRAYSLDQINELRALMAEQKPGEALRYLPRRLASEHLQVIAMVNFKGGSAKTTTSVHLAHFLGLHGYRVLAIDLDPQASLSAMFGAQPETDVGYNETVYAALRYDKHRRPLREVVRKTYFPGVDLIPANIEIMEYEHQTPMVLANKLVGVEDVFFERLRLAIQEVEDDYDVVILDTPPSLGYLTLGAVYAATGMVFTVHPAMLDVSSMSQFLLMMSHLIDQLSEVGATLKKDFIRYLITRHDSNDRPQTQIVSMLRLLFESDVLVPTVLESTAIEAAGLAKRSLYELERGEVGADTVRRARESLDAVNAQILDLMGQSWGRA